MSNPMKRRAFLRTSLAASAGGALAAGSAETRAAPTADKPNAGAGAPTGEAMPCGKIGSLTVSRLLLGGNLLTHFTHSRDLKYVYNLTAHYNTDEKIIETMQRAERHGVNTLSVHNPPPIMKTLRRYRREGMGKMQFIICPTAECKPGMVDYARQVDDLLDAGADAIYLWGVRGDQLVGQGKIDLMKEAVDIAKAAGVPSGVGAHDLRVVVACEKHGVEPDFYIKTFHHHRYPSAPKTDELKGPYAEHPGYWCKDPERTVEVMANVKRPWIAFKVMAAGAIPPKDAFPYVFNGGADHVLAGMFDFEIAEDVKVARRAVAGAARTRPWCS
jgi:hypothetical protein